MSELGTRQMTDHDDAIKRSRSKSGKPDLSHHGYIIAPGLDWILFSRRQRQLMRKLINENDFRLEGVLYVIGKIILSIILLIVPSFVLLYLGHWWMSLVLVGTWGVALMYYREGIYTLPTMGVPVKGVVESAKFTWLRFTGWWIQYSYETKCGNMNRNTYYKPALFKKKNIIKGDAVYVFYSPYNRKISKIYDSNNFLKPSVSQSKYEKMCQLSNLGI